MRLQLIRPDWPAPQNVQAFSTTRRGGCSQECWESFNLGGRCGDDPESVLGNRRLLATQLPAPPQWLRQVHGSNVIAHPGAVDEDLEADALVTAAKNRVCAVLTADCLPVVICNRQGTALAVAHAGWRGLAGGVLEAAVNALGQDPDDLMAWLGPAIGARAYQVGGEVRDEFAAVHADMARAFRREGKRWLLDLYAAARLILGRSGIARVYGGNHCTFSEPERFFSYRRDGVTGRMACLAWLS
jgi:YfiH family protein